MTVTFTLGWWLIMPAAWTSACLYALIKEDDSDAVWPIIFVWAAALAMMLITRFLP